VVVLGIPVGVDLPTGSCRESMCQTCCTKHMASTASIPSHQVLGIRHILVFNPVSIVRHAVGTFANVLVHLVLFVVLVSPMETSAPVCVGSGHRGMGATHCVS
jgi:hypothetical protein